MDLEILQRLGLSKNEIVAYLALLSTGKTTTGPLVKKTGIPSSRIYSTLDSLVAKGAVGYVVEGKVKLFSANRPEVLGHLIELKEQELEETKRGFKSVLPSLRAEFEAERQEYGVEIFEGLRGIKSVYDLSLEVLDRGGCLYTVGYPKLASQLLNAYFLEYHEKLPRLGIKAKLIYDYDTWFAKKRPERPHAEQRYLPEGIHTPGFINIAKDYTAIMVVTEKQKTAILIKNKEVAESYLQYFNLIWGISHRI
jgi:sugar-specific transcriptional regulator TrmB